MILKQFRFLFLIMYFFTAITYAQKIKSIEIFAVPINTTCTPSAQYVDYFFRFLWNNTVPSAHLIMKRKKNLILFNAIESEMLTLKKVSSKSVPYFDIRMCIFIKYKKRGGYKRNGKWLSFDVNREIAEGKYTATRYEWDSKLFCLLSSQIDAAFFPPEKIKD